MIISFSKKICLAQPLSFECFHCILKGTHFLYFYLLLLQLVLCRVVAQQIAPCTVFSAVYVLPLILWHQQKYSEKSENNKGLTHILNKCFAIWTPFRFVSVLSRVNVHILHSAAKIQQECKCK